MRGPGHEPSDKEHRSRIAPTPRQRGSPSVRLVGVWNKVATRLFVLLAAIASWPWIMVDRVTGPLLPAVTATVGVAVIGISVSAAWDSAWPSTWWHGVGPSDRFAGNIAKKITSDVLVAFAVAVSNVVAVFSTYFYWMGSDVSSVLGSLSRPSRLDCVYFTITTLSTVGFGDLNPTTPLARSLTVLLIIAGFGLMTLFVALLIGGIGWAVATMANKPSTSYKG